MLYTIFENILKNKNTYISSNDGKTFEDKIRNMLRSNGFSEISQEEIWNVEGLSKNDAEKKIKDIKDQVLQKNSLEIVKNPFKKIKKSFMFQPLGSQNFPDFLVYLENEIIPIEVKFSTNDKNKSKTKKTQNTKPMWNSNLPKANALYIYAIAGLDVTFFIGSDVLPQEARELLLSFWDRLTEGDLNKTFMEDMHKVQNPFGFYPYIRKAYDQKATASTYVQKTADGNIKISIESFFSENAATRENNLINLLKELEIK